MSIVRIGETMQSMASCAPRSSFNPFHAAPVAVQLFNWRVVFTVITLCCYATSLRAMEDILVVTIDQARVVKVPPTTETLIVGNAAIA
jgi:hypothetical protein